MFIKGKKDGTEYIICTDNTEKVAVFAEMMDTTEYLASRVGAKPKLMVIDDLKATL